MSIETGLHLGPLKLPLESLKYFCATSQAENSRLWGLEAVSSGETAILGPISSKDVAEKAADALNSILSSYRGDVVDSEQQQIVQDAPHSSGGHTFTKDQFPLKSVRSGYWDMKVCEFTKEDTPKSSLTVTKLAG